MIKRICFVLGSNLGDRESNLNKAANLLQTRLGLQQIRQSAILENKALLKSGSPEEWDKDFFNIAISADIDAVKYSPAQTLQIIHKIEEEMGRKRSGIVWQPRYIDIDIAFIAQDIIADDSLTVPHQELTNRDFFLIPISQIEGQWQYPNSGQNSGLTAQEMLRNIKKR